MDLDQTMDAWRSTSARLDRLGKLFVVGCARSGTTWLERLLHGHPEIVLRGEGRFFWHLGPGLSKAIEEFNQSLPGRPDQIAAIRNEEFVFLMRSIIDRQLQRYIDESPQKPSLRVVGDKTPMHALAMPQLAELYPHARFLHIVRDPRDMTISQWLFWAREHDPRDFEEFVHHSITKIWPLNVLGARSAGQALGDRYLEVRYEDLHADPEAEVRRLLAFVEVDASDASVEACLAAGSFRRLSGGRTRGEEDPGSLFRSGTVGSWRDHIPETLAERCASEIADFMRLFGYEASASESVGGVSFGSTAGR